MPGEAWYEGTHSLTFSTGEKETSGPRTGYLKGFNTWTTWHLIPTSKPVVAPPQPRINYVEIPGRDGALDLTAFLTSQLTFGQRSGSWEFIIDNGWESWEATRFKLHRDLHGKVFYIVLEDVPEWYWFGRIVISDYQSGDSNNKVTLNYTVDPRCHYIFADGNWLWDPFNFETDYTDNTGKEPRL